MSSPRPGPKVRASPWPWDRLSVMPQSWGDAGRAQQKLSSARNSPAPAPQAGPQAACPTAFPWGESWFWGAKSGDRRWHEGLCQAGGPLGPPSSHLEQREAQPHGAADKGTAACSMPTRVRWVRAGGAFCGAPSCAGHFMVTAVSCNWAHLLGFPPEPLGSCASVGLGGARCRVPEPGRWARSTGPPRTVPGPAGARPSQGPLHGPTSSHTLGAPVGLLGPAHQREESGRAGGRTVPPRRAAQRLVAGSGLGGREGRRGGAGVVRGEEAGGGCSGERRQKSQWPAGLWDMCVCLGGHSLPRP